MLISLTIWAPAIVLVAPGIARGRSEIDLSHWLCEFFAGDTGILSPKMTGVGAFYLLPGTMDSPHAMGRDSSSPTPIGHRVPVTRYLFEYGDSTIVQYQESIHRPENTLYLKDPPRQPEEAL